MDTYIYVQASDGTPLMPTKRKRHIQKLLKRGKAVVVEHVPFVVRLKYKGPKNTQPLFGGTDPGRDNIGNAVVDENGIVVYKDHVTTRNREIAKLIFEDEGFEVEEAENGKIGLDMVAQSQPGYYDVVLMDIQMPVMDGNAAARAIRGMKEPNCNVPIIAMTAHAFKEERERCLANGMNDYVMKPFVPEDLCAKICKYANGVRTGEKQLSEAKKADLAGSGFDLSPLVEACDGDTAELRRVIDVYAGSVSSDIAELQSAIENADDEKARMKKHALQKTFGYLGMVSAGNTLSQIGESEADYKDLLGRIAGEWQQKLPLIKEYLAKM